MPVGLLGLGLQSCRNGSRIRGPTASPLNVCVCLGQGGGRLTESREQLVQSQRQRGVRTPDENMVHA